MQYHSKNWFFLLLMCFVFVSSSEQSLAKSGDSYYEKPKHAKSLHAPSKVKLKKLKSQHYLVQVMINGKGPFKFMIDTGAEHSVISQRLAQKLNLKPIEKMRFRRNDTIFTADVYRFDSISLGNAEINQYDVVVYPEPTFIGYLKNYFKEDIDGIFGFGAFYHYLWSLDFKKKEMTLENGHLNSTDKDVIRFSTKEKIPLVSVLFKDNKNSKNMDFVIDTGSNEEFTMPPNVASLPFKILKKQQIKSGTHFGEFNAQKNKIKAKASWANKTYHNPTVVYNKAIYGGNLSFGLLGVIALEKSLITFDQRQNLLRLQPLN